MIYLVAFNHEQGVYWCTHVADPPINPRDRRRIRILRTDTGTLLRGAAILPTDEVRTYGAYYEGRYFQTVWQEVQIAMQRGESITRRNLS